MKHVVWKAYWNHEREEKWLNEMSAKGFALMDYFWFRYVFEDAPKGEYMYRIELLEKLPSDLESAAYLRFLSETGVECVATYMRWVYLRRKSTDGEFNIYSDIDSKIKHYSRIIQLWVFVIIINLVAFLMNGIAIWKQITENKVFEVTFVCAAVSGLITFAFLWMMVSYVKKKRTLKREKAIHE